jgi:hypothetical protein
MPRRKTWKLHLTDQWNRPTVKTVHLHLDAAAFKDSAIFPYLIMAANPTLSAPEIERVLDSVGALQHRSLTWIRTRRWMCHATVQQQPRDGQDDRALAIVAAHPRKSARQLRLMLRRAGIWRSLDWLYRSR